MNDKVKDLNELAGLLDGLRPGKRIVQCHGVFDLLHIGHIRHFEQAKKLGDLLVVTLTPDRYVNKGPDRPAFTEQLRAEALAALDCIDYVAINRWPTAIETIKLLKPHIYAKGSEYRNPDNDRTGKIVDEEEAVESVGGRIAFTEDIVFSSSSLINRYLPTMPKELARYLNGFRQRHSLAEVHECLDSIRSLKALVLGEAIIDEYQYSEALGKAGKEPVLVARHVSTERFAGGSLAVANHLAGFCDQVDLLTFLGSRDSREEFIRESLSQNVTPSFIHVPDAPTIVKRRYVEVYPFQKLFEVYIMDAERSAGLAEALTGRLKKILPDYDLVIVTDYGHGMIGPETVELLCSQAPFLAVNTQVNAGNQGFNTVSKYHRADYLCVSENELRLDARTRRRDIKEIMTEAADEMNCPRMLITQGMRGCLGLNRGEEIVEVPAFTEKIVDRVGAGDAVFAVTALGAALGAPIEVLAFIGNAVGAQAVTTVANRRPVDRVSLLKHIESLLK